MMMVIAMRHVYGYGYGCDHLVFIKGGLCRIALLLTWILLLLLRCSSVMASSPASTWISLLEHDLLNDDVSPALWTNHQQDHSLRGECDSLNQENSSSWKSWDDDTSKDDSLVQDKSCLKKRSRDDFHITSGTKACREKMRRDRLNDRFMELSAILEPEKPPKTDKASILRDAARILSHLRMETQQLKNTNRELQETIKELKAEKNELRNEKMGLKSEKESLEKQLKMMNASAYGTHHPSGLGGGPYSSPNHQHPKKLHLFPELPFPVMMSDWMPSTTVDVSSDHILRPPVA